MKIPFKSKLANIKSLEKRNAKFDTLTAEEKRQEIAFDALNLVIGGKLTASYGDYWGDELYDLKEHLIDEEKTDKDLQVALNNNLPTCRVCQRGLMMVSAIRLGNKVSPSDEDVEEGSPELLKGKGFKFSDFEKMETEFEGFGHDGCILPYRKNSEEKLANICCNVIANGNFKVNDKTDYLKEWKITIKTLVGELA